MEHHPTAAYGETHMKGRLGDVFGGDVVIAAGKARLHMSADEFQI